MPASTSPPQMLLSSPPAQQSLGIWDIHGYSISPNHPEKSGKKHWNTLWLGSICLFFANSEHFHAWRLGQAKQLHGLESMRHVPCWQIRKSNLRGCAEVRFRGCTEVELRQPWNEMWRDQRTKGTLHTNSDAQYMTQPCVVQAMDFWWFLPIFALNGGMSISISLTPTEDPKIHQRTSACRVIAWRTSQKRNVCFESGSVSAGESRAPSWYLLAYFPKIFPLEFKLQRPKSWDNFWIFMIKPSLGHLNLRRCSSGPLVTFLLTALEGWDNHGKTPRMMGTASKLSGVFSSFMLIHVRHHKCQKFFFTFGTGQSQYSIVWKTKPDKTILLLVSV